MLFHHWLVPWFMPVSKKGVCLRPYPEPNFYHTFERLDPKGILKSRFTGLIAKASITLWGRSWQIENNVRALSVPFFLGVEQLKSIQEGRLIRLVEKRIKAKRIKIVFCVVCYRYCPGQYMLGVVCHRTPTGCGEAPARVNLSHL